MSPPASPSGIVAESTAGLTPAPASETPGDRCFTQMNLLFAPPAPKRLDRLIEAAGGPDHLLYEGAFAGDLDDGIAAFGGELSDEQGREGEIWMRTGSDATLLQSSESASGIAVWFRTTERQEVPCPTGEY